VTESSRSSTIDYFLFGTAQDLFKESEWKIRHLQSQIVGVFFYAPGLRQVLDEHGVLIKKIELKFLQNS